MYFVIEDYCDVSEEKTAKEVCFDRKIFSLLAVPGEEYFRSILQTGILVIIIYIFIHIWFLVCCVALVLLHSISGPPLHSLLL